MKPNNLQSPELVLSIERDQQDMYFLSNSQRFKIAHFSNYEEEEFYVSNDPIPETLRAWIELSIIVNASKTKRSFDISYKWNGLTHKEEEAVTIMINQVRLALNTGASLSININSILSLSDWAVTLE